MKRYTPTSANSIGGNTMFLPVGKCYTPFSAHQFFSTLPVYSMCSIGGKIFDGVPLKFLNCIKRPNTKALATE
jgi:hypothetical protein